MFAGGTLWWCVLLVERVVWSVGDYQHQDAGEFDMERSNNSMRSRIPGSRYYK